MLSTWERIVDDSRCPPKVHSTAPHATSNSNGNDRDNANNNQQTETEIYSVYNILCNYSVDV